MKKQRIIILLGIISLFYFCDGKKNKKKEGLQIVKDSLVTFYENGNVKKKIYLKDSKIDSIVNYNVEGLFLSKEKVKDSVSFGYNSKNELVYKVSIDKEFNHIGTKISFKDSLILKSEDFFGDRNFGTYLKLNKNQYPKIITSFEDNRLNSSVLFYDNGIIKSLNIYNKKGKIGFHYKYFDNGSLKDKYELKEGKINGVRYLYNKDGEVISKNQYLNGNRIYE